MPSNTDDGIVEKVADALAHHTLRRDDYVHDEKAADRCPCRKCKARSMIVAYESHLRDKGMVVVPRDATFEMIEHGAGEVQGLEATPFIMARNCYRAMVESASPSHSATKSE